MGAPFTSLYIVQSGAVKTQQPTVDGGLNLTGFYLEGDLFGLDAIGSVVYPCEAIALQRTAVCALPFGDFERLCSGVPVLQRWLLARLGGRLKTCEAQRSWCARRESDARVLSFFVDLQRRLEHRQRPNAGFYTMPMRKGDIAFFLGMTPETFSRTLRALRAQRLLEIRAQRFRLPDMAAVKVSIGE